MINPAARASRRYETTLDRAGMALAAGGGMGGVVAVILVLTGGEFSPLRLLLAFVIGAVMCAMAITAVASPLWLVLHVAGWRKPWHAASVGALVALVLFVAAQTYGFGLLEMPPTDSGTLLYRWASALGTSVLLALAAALIAIVMWRIAYRPSEEA